jgi:hypothetical protein
MCYLALSVSGLLALSAETRAIPLFSPISQALVLARKLQHLFAGLLIMHLVPDGAHLAGSVTPTRLLGIRIHGAESIRR